MHRVGLVALIAVSAVVIGFGVRALVDEGDDRAAPTSSRTTTFRTDDVPFTFEYPSSFAARPAGQLPRGYVAVLGVDPVNLLDVRLTAETELSDESLEDDIGGALAGGAVTVLDQRVEEADGVRFTTFEVSDSSTGEVTLSTLRFFRAGGKTWELGCQWNGAGADLIGPACDRMLATFDLG